MKHSENKVFIHPREFYFSEDNRHIHTILGPFVSITLWHPKLNFGGMCHFTLPENPNVQTIKSKTLDGHYADDIMHMFRMESSILATKLNEYDEI